MSLSSTGSFEGRSTGSRRGDTSVNLQKGIGQLAVAYPARRMAFPEAGIGISWKSPSETQMGLEPAANSTSYCGE
jgi:hypothetical protein